jgi:hypothetical protein
MHPHLIGACADDRQIQMLANAEIARRARKAGSEHRRAHIKAVPGRWVRRFTPVAHPDIACRPDSAPGNPPGPADGRRRPIPMTRPRRCRQGAPAATPRCLSCPAPEV